MDLTNVATLFTTAFYQPPGGYQVTRFRRLGHLLTLYFLPLLVYIPVGILCHWIGSRTLVGYGVVGFGPFEESLPLIALAVSFLVAPLPYIIFSMIYYAVSLLYKVYYFGK